jgi:2'-5' RNA ligase
MRHRIFIAVNLPEDVRKQLSDCQKKLITLPVRWTKKEGLHITLVFLGYLNDEELLDIIKITKEVASQHSSFSINLNKILYGPPKKFPPRMIWVEGEESQEMANLQKDLEDSLYSSPLKGANEREARPYSPHITLGRIKTWEFRRVEPEERQEINEEVSPPTGGLSFPVESIEVMESELKQGGSEYIVLETCNLKLEK